LIAVPRTSDHAGDRPALDPAETQAHARTGGPEDVAADAYRPIGVLLGELGTVISLGIRQVLQNDPRVRVVGETGDHIKLEADIAQLAPQVVVLGEAGVARRSVSRHLRAVRAGVGVVVLANWPTRAYSARLLSHGVAACLPVGGATTPDILEAVRLAAEGKQMCSPEPSRPNTNVLERIVDLTRREREVLELLTLRGTNDEIGTRLHISPQTVHSHVKNILRKLGVNSRKALVGIDIPDTLS
jgi:DNA-binding NarL/FixJ family response regulator